MDKIEVYGFEDADGNPQDWHTFSAEEARDHAQKYSLKWIAYSYEYADSELVMDFTQQEGEE